MLNDSLTYFNIPFVLVYILPYIGAGALAWAGYVLGQRFTPNFTGRSRAARLDKFAGGQASLDKKASSAVVGSFEHKVRIAFIRIGIDAAGNEENAGEAAMNASAKALQVFSQHFGKYPHKSLSVVIADFKDSMEFSALYFHSRSFYDLYDGTEANYLTTVAVHETGHQSWFEQVANDQAQEPWLDESLTTYSELIYYETLHPDLVPWWWS